MDAKNETLISIIISGVYLKLICIEINGSLSRMNVLFNEIHKEFAK